MKTIKAKVHMLPFIEDKHQGLTNNSHLYVTTDEEIKEGDWFLHPKYEKGIKTGLEVIKADSSYFGGYGYDWHFCKKIIATTDPKLTKSKEIQFGNMLMLDTNGDGSYYHYKGETEFSLSREELIQKGLIVPQPTQAFIEAYCKQGGIDEVDVGYDVITNTYDNIADLMCPHSVAEYEQTTSSISKLKVDPIYNTITTHLVEPEYYAVYDEVTNKTLHIQAPTLKDAEIIAAAIDFDNFVDGQSILTNPSVSLVEEKIEVDKLKLIEGLGRLRLTSDEELRAKYPLKPQVGMGIDWDKWIKENL